MTCVSPFVLGRGAFPCGQCPPCRSRARRVWFHRLILEARDHEYSSFVTLTYDESSISSDGSLRPEDARNWLKRLRRRIAPRKIRFYLVGEYGDRTWRPHYHCALFGWPGCLAPLSRNAKGGEVICECPACSVVRETWGFGHVRSASLTEARMQYLCGYLLKKMTRFDDPRLEGRHPEFSRKSLRPGLGANAMHDVASEMLRYGLEKRSVPITLRHGRGELLLGRYLRSKLKLYTGSTVNDTAENAEAQLRLVREFAFNNSRSVKSVFKELNEGYASQLVQRAATQKRTL